MWLIHHIRLDPLEQIGLDQSNSHLGDKRTAQLENLEVGMDRAMVRVRESERVIFSQCQHVALTEVNGEDNLTNATLPPQNPEL